MNVRNTLMSVEVAYAKPCEQVLITVDLDIRATAGQAIRLSGLLECFPEIDLTTASIGIFGRTCALDQLLRAGDRIEIYRPLATDPRTARRERQENHSIPDTHVNHLQRRKAP